MKILSIGSNITYKSLEITHCTFSQLHSIKEIESYDYILISGGDGAIRRIIKALYQQQHARAAIILNPIGSFNVIAKMHHVPKYTDILEKLSQQTEIIKQKQKFYTLNNEIFLFSAGNMGDLQHIFLSETLRFGILKKGITKYILAVLFLIPVHLIMTPFMLLSTKRFFVFTPAKFIRKFGSLYGKVEKTITIDLENSYNLVELDGDIVTIEESVLEINLAGSVEVVTQ